MICCNFIYLFKGWGHTYGPACDQECKCDAENGLCWPQGEGGTGECLYCTNQLAYGKNCDRVCNCDKSEYYCDGGINGKGCTKFDYGGIKIPYPYYTYGGIGVALLVIFFTMTWCKTREHFVESGDIPFFPRKDSFVENEIDANFNHDRNRNQQREQHQHPQQQQQQQHQRPTKRGDRQMLRQIHSNPH